MPRVPETVVASPPLALRRVVPGSLGAVQSRTAARTVGPTMTIKWGLSVLDWHAHAIDENADHPIGVYVARCGHRLMMVTTLHESPPSRICAECGRAQS